MQETAQTATFEQVRKTLSTKETSFKKKKQKKIAIEVKHGIDQEKEQVFRPYFFSFLRKISL